MVVVALGEPLSGFYRPGRPMARWRAAREVVEPLVLDRSVGWAFDSIVLSKGRVRLARCRRGLVPRIGPRRSHAAISGWGRFRRPVAGLGPLGRLVSPRWATSATTGNMRALFATAEFAPHVKVGGLGDFSSGLTRVLMAEGIEVEVILPDYGFAPFVEHSRHHVHVPDWAGPAEVRRGSLDGMSVSLISAPRISRPDPYVDSEGVAWADNDMRFFAFSAALAAEIASREPDVVHLNDWHTAPVFAFSETPPPSIFTIHNLAYQGETASSWGQRLPWHRDRYLHEGEINPMAGAIALADRVVTVSSKFATESLPPNAGFGLARLLKERGDDFIGILNGIDTEVWDPSTDPHLGHVYDSSSLEIKRALKSELVAHLGWPDSDGPLIGMVTRLTDQKGVDIALSVVPHLAELDARMILLGSGDLSLANAAEASAIRHPSRFRFQNGYDDALAHRIFGASDLYLMPSRFEPAGLTQMQAMRYGAIPVVTDVGGLHDTVIDDDVRPGSGTGFVADAVKPRQVRSTLSRAVGAWRSDRRIGIIERGMAKDWSWADPARRYVDLYEEVTSAR